MTPYTKSIMIDGNIREFLCFVCGLIKLEQEQFILVFLISSGFFKMLGMLVLVYVAQ